MKLCARLSSAWVWIAATRRGRPSERDCPVRRPRMKRAQCPRKIWLFRKSWDFIEPRAAPAPRAVYAWADGTTHVWWTATIPVSCDCHGDTRIIVCSLTCVLWQSRWYAYDSLLSLSNLCRTTVWGHTYHRLLSYLCLMTAQTTHVLQTALICIYALWLPDDTRVTDCSHTYVFKLPTHTCVLWLFRQVWQVSKVYFNNSGLVWGSDMHHRPLSYPCLMTAQTTHVW